jgi:aminopeptidase N
VLSNYTVLFNTPQSQDSPAPAHAPSGVHSSDTWKQVRFQRTPVVMTAYTVAFAIGAFDYIEGQGPHGLPVRVYTPPGKSSWGQFALKVTIDAVVYFESKCSFDTDHICSVTKDEMI